MVLLVYISFSLLEAYLTPDVFLLFSVKHWSGFVPLRSVQLILFLSPGSHLGGPGPARNLHSCMLRLPCGSVTFVGVTFRLKLFDLGENLSIFLETSPSGTNACLLNFRPIALQISQANRIDFVSARVAVPVFDC